MRKISILATILMTSFVMTLAGLVAGPIATASETETVRISATFPIGTSVLTNAQKAAIKKAVITSGTDATFVVTGAAGKLPGVSDSAVRSLAKKRAQVVKSYLVKLGVDKSNVTTKLKISKFGIALENKIVRSFATPAATDTPAVAAAAPVALTCAAGGICAVGDRGPGGGIVYYVSATNFTSTGSTCNTACKYLEVAPATWQSAGASVANDLTYVWSSDTTNATGQDIITPSTESAVSAYEKFNWKIGQGFNNTRIMKVTSATSAAQAKVLAYAGNSTAGQWFIPSMNELNELCKFARGQSTGVLTAACNSTGTLKTGSVNDLGGFVENYYWSSSESRELYSWSQSFVYGSQDGGRKDFGGYFRPVRAF